jgi:5-methylcytosine-specific restriction endonuclease McrA
MSGVTLAKAERQRRHVAKYHASSKGRAAVAKYRASLKGKKAIARYRVSPKGKATQARYTASPEGKVSMARYLASPKGRALQSRVRAKYLASPKGKAMRARADARRYYGCPCRNYSIIRERLPELQCYMCGRPAEQVDHILPISLARIWGVNADDYVAPICRRCHKCKTVLDIYDLRRVRAE